MGYTCNNIQRANELIEIVRPYRNGCGVEIVAGMVGNVYITKYIDSNKLHVNDEKRASILQEAIGDSNRLGIIDIVYKKGEATRIITDEKGNVVGYPKNNPNKKVILRRNG